MKLISTFFKHCLTGIDGETYDPARVIFFLGALAFIAYSGYTVWKLGTFDPQSYGLGFGGILGGGGAGIGLKAKTEPEGD